MNWRGTTVAIGMLGVVGCESPDTTASRDPVATTCPLGSFSRVDLVSDQSGASIVDPSLIDPWDITTGPTSPFWVASRGGGVITLYTDNGSGIAEAALTVTSAGGPPTGVVFNLGSGFKITNGTTVPTKAVFLFATSNGLIEGWAPSVAATTTVTAVDNSHSASYTSLAFASTSAGDFLYATDFRHGTIDVFSDTFVQRHLPFSDPDIPAHYHPYNIKLVHGRLLVTYAAQHGNDDAPQGGHGYVDAFDTNGNLLMQVASGHPLKAPGAITAAPLDFGPFSNALVVGNTLDGEIDAYDLGTGDFLGRMRDDSGKPISIDGLHAFWVGNGANGGQPNNLYFVAGPDEGQHGVLGSLFFVPKP